ncbi:hypothetical protein IWW37_004542 [Coemansia sp. RSA 2050]|nr:hypothetical protein IWW37_004542 [Coemansia sp. RSA 2050]KAJ2731284.1 hypothetical protein IW152_004675 [Coemansia sp. BCRC 34962]
MGKSRSGIGGEKYMTNKKGASKRGIDVIPQSSLLEKRLVVRISKDVADTATEDFFTFDLDKLGINVNKATVSELYDLDDSAYERNDIVQTCFTTGEKEEDSNEEEEEEEDEDEGEGDDEEVVETTDKAKDGEALDDWVEVTKEVDAIGKKAGGEDKPAEDEEASDDEEEASDDEDEEEEEDDSNPYKLVFRNKKGNCVDIGRDVPISDLFSGGDVVITIR